MPVTVKVEKLNPVVTVLYYDTIQLDHTGQEETAVRFVINNDGTIEDVNTRAKSLVKLSRKGPTTPQESDLIPNHSDGTSSGRGIVLER